MQTLENSWLEDLAAELPPLADYKTIASLCGMSKGSLANLCSEGNGIEGGVIIAKKRLFPRKHVLAWIAARAAANTEKA